MSTFLAIAIPTYNRATILRENILAMSEVLKTLQIPLYLYDDSSNDDTQIMNHELAQKGIDIIYKRNIPSNGHDKNVLSTIRDTDAEFVWTLGDSFFIDNEALKEIYQFLEKNSALDFLGVNVSGRAAVSVQQLYTSFEEVYKNIGWHLTLTGATIYRRAAIDFEKYDVSKYKNFPQISIIFETLYYNQGSFFWWGNDAVIFPNSNNEKKSYWLAKVFETFITDLSNTLSNLPMALSAADIDYFIKMHADKTQLFGVKNFISFRGKGYFDANVLNQYHAALKKYIAFNPLLLQIIAYVPKPIVATLIKWKKR